MKFFAPENPPQHVLRSAAGNLALDETLLRPSLVFAGEPAVQETLRVWEESLTTVIVGRGSRLADEVELDRCNVDGVSVLRRCSGGCAIVTGPGCVLYSVVLDLHRRPELRIIDKAHDFVLRRIQDAIAMCGIAQVSQAGLSDLVIEANSAVKKFSGNSLKITRDALLYHGTLLYDFRLSDIARYLRQPPREPTYRNHRDHASFVTNVPLDPADFASSLRNVWGAREILEPGPITYAAELATSKYNSDDWNHRH